MTHSAALNMQSLSLSLLKNLLIAIPASYSEICGCLFFFILFKCKMLFVNLGYQVSDLTWRLVQASVTCKLHYIDSKLDVLFYSCNATY